MPGNTGSKKALVLSAGGMFGAYQAGAWEALSKWFKPDIVVGTSVGALNGWAIAGGCAPAALSEFWLDPGCATLANIRFSPAGVLDGNPLHARIRDLWSRYEPRTEVGVVAVELPLLRPRLFQNSEIGWTHLAASCAVLFCYPQIRIDGRLYTDGGLLTVLPIWAAVEMGATTVLAINLLPQAISRVVRTLIRGVRKLAPRPPAPPQDLKLITVAPDRPLGSLRESLFWRQELVEEWVEMGRRDALHLSETWISSM